MTRCLTADGGTLVDMRSMDRVLEITPATVTVEAGARFVDVAEALRQRGLEFFVNFEIGTLTMGAAACTHTKDSSFPGQHGQISSYCVGMRVVSAAGDVVQVTEDDPELMRVLRTGYGLLGIVCEVTFRVRPARPLAFDHKVLTIEELRARVTGSRARDHALMYYLFPFQNRAAIERRWYRDEGRPRSSVAWRIRNVAQATLGPAIARAVSRYAPAPLRNRLLELNLAVFQKVVSRLRSAHSTAADQIIRYPEKGGWSAYTFSIWTFPESRFPAILREYVDFCKRHETEHGFRCDMPTVGYRIDRDDRSVLSYAPDEAVLTLDPVSTGGSGWYEFLDAFNEFGSRNEGIPLLNQSPRLRPDQARRAFGSRLDQLATIRQKWDPDERMLSSYFDRLLSRA
jgi:FAD/FMN-containing dehydrogenase